MDVREKLVELIEKASYECDEGTRDLYDMGEVADGIADFLIANSVTVQEWISVKDRLPEKDVLVICMGARGGIFLGRSPRLFSDGTAYFDVSNSRRARFATHWMPLPQPPKE